MFLFLLLIGFHIQSMSNQIFERVVQYDAFDNPHPTCGINTTVNAGTQCTISIRVDEDLQPPILIYYQIENFHQNHRKYQKSRDLYQVSEATVCNALFCTSCPYCNLKFLKLYGETTQSALQAELCQPLNILGDIRLNPCGLIANTFFNDVIELTDGTSSDGGVDLIMQEDGIAWQSDLDYMYRQPNGFVYEECPDSCTPDCCDGDEWSCSEPTLYKDGKCYRYFYPDDDTTQYLYETYPQVISPIDGVLNEHFIVWMRVAALPTFRKLYGWINQPIAEGTVLTFQITNNWEVGTFEGRKSLVISNTNMFGGKNQWMGLYYYCVGFFCIGAASFFALKQLVRPRRLADKHYLHFKQE
jgi:LEM3 (ligand-effect modulator 3) family / CDC50 family